MKQGLFICGAADRSGRGKRCSSSCCCWGGPIFSLPCTVFWGVKRKNYVSIGVWKGKNLISKGVWKGNSFVSKGVWKGKNFVSKWMFKSKKFVQNLIDQFHFLTFPNFQFQALWYSSRRRSVKGSLSCFCEGRVRPGQAQPRGGSPLQSTWKESEGGGDDEAGFCTVVLRNTFFQSGGGSFFTCMYVCRGRLCCTL